MRRERWRQWPLTVHLTPHSFEMLMDSFRFHLFTLQNNSDALLNTRTFLNLLNLPSIFAQTQIESTQRFFTMYHKAINMGHWTFILPACDVWNLRLHKIGYITVRIRKVWTLWFKIFLCQKLVCFPCIYFIAILAFLQNQSVNLSFLTILDYSSCGLIMSKLNQSVHAFSIRTVTHNLRERLNPVFLKIYFVFNFEEN